MPPVPGAGLLKRLVRRLPRRDAREPGARNHISLGAHCHMAHILKAEGLRTWSGPFDWIFSAPGMVRDCLADDFSALLDRTQYETTPPDERMAPHETRCRHRLYRDRHAIPFVFNHHDPASSEADYRFLEAGVRRLRTTLDTPGTCNRFYLMTTVPTAEEIFPEIRRLLAARRAQSHLTVLELVPGAENPATVERASEAGFDHLRVETRSPSTGIRFADPRDDAFVTALVGVRARLLAEP
ncbi:peptidase [Methylobacterium sp. Leaf456]|uniref:DUF1796 family putative cysteine peptidase n=1 Tax=Methylobacterium sp. Leaf456 TaxID=1736382 RepID=UPI0006FCC7D4|nr:DUF1796 family putative cysteine peptidase [Methylobacterium sp. Leaf456]KQT57010.1 peptidase [Methylobacterium sp. Leaf456]